MLLAKGLFRSHEKDNFTEGLDPDSGHSMAWQIEFKGENKEELFKKIKKFHNIEDDSIQLDGGIFYVQKYEKIVTEGWATATTKDVANWKQGMQDLYLVNYSYQIYKPL